MAFRIILLLVLIQFPCRGLAEIYHLFRNGNQVEDYNAILSKLTQSKAPFKEPIYLRFDDQSTIEVTQFLGKGGLTAVFRRADGRVLRIPKASGDAYFRTGPNGELRNHGPYTDGMQSYFKAMNQILHIRNIAPHVYSQDSRVPEYITVDYFPAKFNLADFYEDRESLFAKGLIDPSAVTELERAFIQFAIRFAPFKKIGDFKMEQIVSDGVSWRMLDCSEPVVMAEADEVETPFRHRNMGPRLPPNMLQSIEDAIYGARRRLRSGPFCGGLFN